MSSEAADEIFLDDLVEIKEGETGLLVPEHEEGVGPKSSDDEVFYNPAMEINRDISISFLKAIGKIRDRGIDVLDGMAASGVRGVRIANETDPSAVTINDVNRSSVQLIKKNIEKNDLNDVHVTHRAIETLVMTNRYEFDYIDIDPFGTPVPFFQPVVRFVSRDGIIAVTATDTALLCGTYPKACYRRYSAWPRNNWCRHENGLRILIGFCVREAARYDRSASPLFSYYDGHHFRTYLEIEEGARKADSCLEDIKTYSFGDYGWEEDNRHGDMGPLWAGRLFSKDILKKMEPMGKLQQESLDLWKEEHGFLPFFYDTNIIAKKFKTAPPPLDELIERLKDEGNQVSKTHFTPTGFKTDAPKEEVKEVFLSITSR